MSDIVAVPHLGIVSSRFQGKDARSTTTTSDRLLSCGSVPLGTLGLQRRTTEEEEEEEEEDAGGISRACWSDPAILSGRGCGGAAAGAALGVQFQLGTDQYNTGAARFEAEMANNSGIPFGSPNVMVMRNASRSTDTLVAKLAASCCPSDPLQAMSRSVGQLEEGLVIGCDQKHSFYPTFEASVSEIGDEDAAADDCPHNVEKKRRLTFDQVRSLERNFELENKLEPEKKMQLAKELGLQPRQVAVWFQNRRARWKTKQLERDYEVLTLDYNKLKSKLEAVLEEKGELEAKVRNLRAGKVQPEEDSGCEAEDVSKVTERTKNPGTSNEFQVKPDSNVVEVRKDGSTSLDSTSSEILDADSPRTIDSTTLSLARTGDEKTRESAQKCTDHLMTEDRHPKVNMDHTAQDDNIQCGRVIRFSPQCIAVKLEEGSTETVPFFQDQDSCNYLLTQVDEQGTLPWWNWPMSNTAA